MSLKHVWRNTQSLQRYHGIGAASRFLSLAVLRKVVTLERVYIYALDASGPRSLALRTSLVRPASLEELVRLAAEPAWQLLPPQTMATLYGEGHRCAVNVVDGNIAGYSWMNPNRLEVAKLKTSFELRSNEVHIYKGFTLPMFRGLKLGVDRFRYWQSCLSGMGRARILTDFAFDNPWTLTRVPRVGLQRQGAGMVLKTGGRRRLSLEGTLLLRNLRPLSVVPGEPLPVVSEDTG